MSVLIDRRSRFIIQGITGNVGRFSARDMQEYGTAVVGGISNIKRESAVEAGVRVISGSAWFWRKAGIAVPQDYRFAESARQGFPLISPTPARDRIRRSTR